MNKLPPPSFSLLVRHWLYVRWVRWARRQLGIKIHYRVEYQEYLLTPRWLLMRWMRMAMDGYTCREPGCRRHTTLQMHHKHYNYKNAKGNAGFLLELFSLETRCDEHHDQNTGKPNVSRETL